MLGHAAEQDSRQTAPASLAEDDQIHRFAFGDIENERRGIAQAGNRESSAAAAAGQRNSNADTRARTGRAAAGKERTAAR